MNSLVCIAYVPDTETKIKIGADGKSIDEADVKWIVSPYDEYALEEALKIKEAKGAGTVTVVSVGPERAKTGLRECLARGADEAIWVDSSGLALPRRARRSPRRSPPWRRPGAHDFFWFGQKGVGYDESLVGPMSAELLGCRTSANVIKLEVGDGKITAHREIEGAHEVVECTLPGRADRAEGPERAALRVAQGHHGGQEEADRREEAGGARRPGGRSRAGEGPLAQARAAARAAGRQAHSRPTIRRRPRRSWCGCCARKRRSSSGMKFLVFIEQRDGKIRKASLEALSLARKLGGGPVGGGPARQGGRGALAEDLGRYGAGHRLRRRPRRARPLQHQGLRRRARRGGEEGNARRGPDRRDVDGQGRRAALRGPARRVGRWPTSWTCASRATASSAGGPVYSGKARAEVDCGSAKLQIATTRPNVFPAEAADGGADAEGRDAGPAAPIDAAGEGRARSRSPSPRSSTSSEADIIVSGGRGIKGPENWPVIRDLQEALGAALGASRAVGRRGLDRPPAPGRPDRQGRLADALRRLRHLRRDPAPGRHGDLQGHRRDQQGSRGADLQGRDLRHRRRSLPDRAGAREGRPGRETGRGPPSR